MPPVQAAVAVVEPAQAAEVVVAPAVVVVAAVAGVDGEDTNMKTSTLVLQLASHGVRMAILAGALAVAPGAIAQKAFPTPDAAAEAVVDGLARHDDDALRTVLGADYRKYLPLHDDSASDRTNFLEAWARAHKIVPAGADKAFLGAGRNGWTLPVPIVKSAAGWQFDVKAAPEEMRTRRIGRNELAAIQVSLAYTDAQEEYVARDWNGDGVKEFAMRGLSTPGKRNGLYWASLPGERESPLGAEFANAQVGQPYHGYHYRVLTAQGKDAAGGAKSYVKNGRMTEGYALIAWPAKYGDTGIMTFIVNRDATVHQKDLGPGTDAAARAVTAYNPDASWNKVPRK